MSKKMSEWQKSEKCLSKKSKKKDVRVKMSGKMSE